MRSRESEGDQRQSEDDRGGESTRQRHGRKRRELNSSSSSLRTSCSLPTFSLRVLVDRAVLLPLRAKEKIPWRSRRSSDQRRTRFTLHRHTKNPALNKGRIQDSTSSLPYNWKGNKFCCNLSSDSRKFYSILFLFFPARTIRI